jgi:hypothetical protein
MFAQHLAGNLAQSAFDQVSANCTTNGFAHDKAKAGVGLCPIPL